MGFPLVGGADLEPQQTHSILLLPASLTPASVLGDEGKADQGLTVLTLTRQSAREWREQCPSAVVFDRVSLRTAGSVTGQIDHGHLLRLQEQLLSDPRTHYLISREWSPGLVDVAPFNLLPRFGEVCRNTLALLTVRRPDVVVARSTPHLVEPWVVCRIAELLGIPVVMSAEAILPGRSWLVSGVDEQRVLPLGSLETVAPAEEDRLESAISGYIADRQRDYGRGVPPRHQGSLEKSRDGGWSLRVEWGEMRRQFSAGKSLRHRLARSAYGLRSSSTRRRLWQAYRTLATRPPVGPHLTLFLHYQPERTTLPEAGLFGDQYALASLLSATLPDGWTLHVREHPATFVGPGPFHPGFRSPELYRAIEQLRATFLTPLSSDPFGAIDESEFVVTATGTVGLESLCRGIPVIVAGRAQYRDAPGVVDLSLRDPGVVAKLQATLEQRDVLASATGALSGYLLERATWSVGSSHGPISHSIEAREEAHASAIGALFAGTLVKDNREFLDGKLGGPA